MQNKYLKMKFIKSKINQINIVVKYLKIQIYKNNCKDL